MKDVSEVHFRVIDKGIFLPIAQRLAREGAGVSYYTPHERAFETVRDMIGDGLDRIERVESIWQDKDSVDCWVFPDIGFSWEQKELLSQGKIVWGSRDADSIEISRGKFLSVLELAELPVSPYHKVVGMDNLREHLRDKKDKFIKISRFRGDWETLHWRDWEQDESELDARSVKLGPWKEVITFYVFDKIDTEIEDGCDTYCIDGKFPSLIIHGMEAKDKAYIGTFQRFDELPIEVRSINDAFGPILAQYGYKNYVSSEIRITESRQSYFIDPTLRGGSPPSQVICEMIGNLGDITWRGANGELVDPIPSHKFGVQGLLCAKDRHNWNTIRFPDELKQWVKCGFCAEINGRLCFPPDEYESSGQIGWLVGVGDTAEAAIDHLRTNAEQLPCGVTCEFSSLADLLKEVNEAEEKGMEFSDQIMPGPEVVLAEK